MDFFISKERLHLNKSPELVELEFLLRESDIVSLHINFLPENVLKPK